MSKRDELNNLADRCEREEGCWQLDLAISDALGFCHDGGTPWYSRSLDAAVSLVPEGWFWLRKSEHTATCCLPGVSDKDWGTHIDANAHTPALALCAAALRARAALEDPAPADPTKVRSHKENNNAQ